ncbi:hypothetical protein [Nocardioides sp.]|uniref:hypothetical protein n=1 Tax=Nocardioides sp. TaxID=35761 RepID=UPI0035B314AE
MPRSVLSYPLQVRDRRVLVPIGVPCPYRCGYCYAPEIEPSAPIDPASIVDAVHTLDPSSFDVIQLGYDGDPVASLGAMRALLPGLAATGRHINVSTKARISERAAAVLASAHQATGAGVSLNVSMSCWDSAAVLEAGTPHPQSRLDGARDLLASAGVPFVVALRPILPKVGDDEVAQIISGARDAGATGLVTGPLYATEDEAELMEPGLVISEHRHATAVGWSPLPLERVRILDDDRVARIRAMAEGLGVRHFTNNAQALSEMMRHE